MSTGIWRVSGQQVAVFAVFSEPGRRIPANRDDFEVFGAGESRNAFHQAACRALAAQLFRRFHVIDRQDAPSYAVSRKGGCAFFGQFKAVLGRVVDDRCHDQQNRAQKRSGKLERVRGIEPP
jgi:hypothetical protein